MHTYTLRNDMSDRLGYRDDRQYNTRRILHPRMHRVLHGHQVLLCGDLFAGIWIGIVMRRLAAGDGEAYAMTLLELIGGVDLSDLDLVNFTRFHQLLFLKPVAVAHTQIPGVQAMEVNGSPVGIHIGKCE